ncbi:DUF6962 family protein [Pontibacter sp. G13]|uniref:DUF6962 family protein n=1 Tax=Pontibacter sp. G13 TaxID=3074898 RepID=UPI00288B21E7|nr:hypothetical protein [Pontibacter sp. G13]WNJ18913.1 hypothetical protein RJD25_00360 [Pontibacter sp. G13]
MPPQIISFLLDFLLGFVCLVLTRQSIRLGRPFFAFGFLVISLTAFLGSLILGGYELGTVWELRYQRLILASKFAGMAALGIGAWQVILGKPIPRAWLMAAIWTVLGSYVYIEIVPDEMQGWVGIIAGAILLVALGVSLFRSIQQKSPITKFAGVALSSFVIMAIGGGQLLADILPAWLKPVDVSHVILMVAYAATGRSYFGKSR